MVLCTKANLANDGKKTKCKNKEKSQYLENALYKCKFLKLIFPCI